MATELRELRGLPEAIQKQFEEQQTKATGTDDEMPEPLMTMSQWKALLESNKKASSLPPAPVKAGLFTAACEKVKATPRHCLQAASPATAASINAALSASTIPTNSVCLVVTLYLLTPKEFSSKLPSTVLKRTLTTKRSKDCRCWLPQWPNSVLPPEPRMPTP